MLGISFLSKVDFGFEYARYQMVKTNSKIKIASAFTFITYNVKRENSRSNLQFLLGYISSSISGFGTDNSGPVLGLGLSFKIFYSDYFTLSPGLNITYSFLTAEDVYVRSYYNNYFTTKAEKYINHTRSLGLNFNSLFHLGHSSHLLVTPYLSKDLINTDNSYLPGIGAAFILELTPY